VKRFLLCLLPLAVLVSSTAAIAFREDFNSLDATDWAVYANSGSVYVDNGWLAAIG